VVLGEKSGFPSARLVDTGMSVVSVLTGQHSLWGKGEIEESHGFKGLESETRRSTRHTNMRQQTMQRNLLALESFDARCWKGTE
jgi:hypothetical protein